MKKIFTYLLLLASFISNATTYYISPSGDDSRTAVQAQNINTPWRTLTHGCSVLVAGDTLYCRGGTYVTTSTQIMNNRSGTAANNINIYAYGLESPVFDYSGTTHSSSTTGFSINGCNFIHVFGLRFTGITQINNAYHYGMALGSNCNNNILEFCAVDHIGGSGINMADHCSNNLVLNCDASYCADPLSTVPYGGSNGFDITNQTTSNNNIFRTCRAWWISDDGYDCFNTNGTVIYDRCWSFWNGYIPGTFTAAGNGDGFKAGPTPTTVTAVLRTFTNNLSFENRLTGFDENFNSNGTFPSILYNNTAFKNVNRGFEFGLPFTEANTLRNNVAYFNSPTPTNPNSQVNINPQSVQDHNSWNGLVTVTNADFVSLDSSGMDGPRQSNGSLPVLTFLHLAPGSDLIDAGVSVGLPFCGTAPDMGCFEVCSTNIAPKAFAGSDQTITLPTSTTTLIGSGTDQDGTVVGYNWTQIGGTASTIATPNASTTNISGLTTIGSRTYKLTVTDNQGATGTDTVIVLVNAANVPPVANAGADKIITLPTNTVTLVGSGTDADGTISAYLWSFVSVPATATPNFGSQSTAGTTVNNLTVAGLYTIQLQVTDNQGATGTDQMTITVNPQPTPPPVVTPGPNQTLTLPTSASAFAGNATAVSPATSISVHTWSFVSGPGPTPTITTPGGYTSAVSGMITVGSYTFQLSATDNLGHTTTATMVILVNPAPNQPPVAHAGADQTITLPTNSVSLNGSTSTDPDGSIVAFLWSKISGPASFTIVSASQAITTVNNLTAGVYQFTLRVTDNVGATGLDTVQITVNAANVPPTVTVGANQTITLPTSSVTLVATASDPDGSIATYAWTKISGPAGGTISTPAAATTNVTGYTNAGTYIYQVVVTDNQGATGSTTTQITVNAAIPPNQPPVVNAGANQTITLPVNSVTQAGSATDPDGTVVSYQWTKISGPATFTIVTPTTPTTVINNLVAGTYIFQLAATDNLGAVGTNQVTIIVLPRPNTNPTVSAGSDITITLPTNTATLTGTATSTNPGGSITVVLWTQIGGTASTITSNSTLVTGITGLSTAGSRTYKLQVTDNFGSTASDTVIVLVNPAPNQPPVADAGINQTITLPTGTPTGTVTLSGGGTDPDGTIVAYLWSKVSGPASFSIAANSQKSTAVSNLIFGVYNFQLKVTDNSGATATDQVQITVDTTYVPPPPFWTPPTANAGADQKVIICVFCSTTSVNLSGSGHSDSGNIVSYQWTELQGNTTVNFSSPNTAATTASNLKSGFYIIQLKVVDNMAYQATDTMNITVTKNHIIIRRGKIVIEDY